jgi:hypothetical protein
MSTPNPRDIAARVKPTVTPTRTCRDKAVFTTYDDAVAFLRRVAITRDNPYYYPRSCYRCPGCGAWHTTAQPPTNADTYLSNW